MPIDQIFWGHPLNPETDTAQLNQVLNNIYQAVALIKPVPPIVRGNNANALTIPIDGGQPSFTLEWHIASATTSQGLYARFNGDSGNNYLYSVLYDTNGAVGGGANGNVLTSSARLGWAVAAGNPGSSGILRVMDNSSTYGSRQGIVDEVVVDTATSRGHNALTWNSSAVITSVLLFLDNAATIHTASWFRVTYP